MSVGRSTETAEQPFTPERDERDERKEPFQLVADIAPVMIWMSDSSRRCTYFNRGWLDFVGRPLAAELGFGWVDGVYADDLAGCLAVYDDAFARQEGFTVQYRLRRHDGAYRWVKDTGAPRFDAAGTFDGYVGSCIDITNERLAGEALATLGGRLMAAQEQERSRLAWELHDDICQRLAVLAIELQQLADDPLGGDIRSRSEVLLNRTVDISNGVQALSHELHCQKLEYLGIVAAIRGFCGELAAQQAGVTIDFTSTGVPTHLPHDISLCLFRILQEALRNALKYSGVRHVEILLQCTSAAILFTIRDRGRGFEPDTAMRGHGLGLISMRERAHLVKGTILVTSRPGFGTEIKLSVPVDASLYRRGMHTSARHVYLIPSDRAS
jgi:PAS domain S-box-containing protein